MSGGRQVNMLKLRSGRGIKGSVVNRRCSGVERARERLKMC